MRHFLGVRETFPSPNFRPPRSPPTPLPPLQLRCGPARGDGGHAAEGQAADGDDAASAWGTDDGTSSGSAYDGRPTTADDDGR